jgi:hypothetical protein
MSRDQHVVWQVAEKSADFLAADEWMKREWPKIIAECLLEDT